MTHLVALRRHCCAEGGHLYIGHSERVSGDAKALFDNTGITTYRYTGKSGRRA